MVYLRDNPPARSQYRSPRRSTPSGVVVLHSTESLPDVNPPDTGSDQVAKFIRSRSDPGSYHFLCDSDSYLQLVRLGDEAFHDGTGTNSHSIGISGAYRAHQFASLPRWWRMGCIRQMALAAREAAEYVLLHTGTVIPPRRITVTQARNGEPGFVTHGMLDPHRRSDPDGTNTGARFPWADFFAHYTPPGDLIMDDEAREAFKELRQILTFQQSQLVNLHDKLEGIEGRQVPEATVRADIRTTRNIAEKVGAEISSTED